MKQAFCFSATRFLNLLMLVLVPKKRRPWAQALISEQSAMANSSERLIWAAGGVFMGVREFLASLFSNPLIWGFGSVFGFCAALLDLHSAARWPYLTAVCAIAFALTLCQPSQAWRWALLAGLALPIFVLLSDNWGPYEQDRFDVFYGLLPSAVGMLLGLGLIRAVKFQPRPPANRGVAY